MKIVNIFKRKKTGNPVVDFYNNYDEEAVKLVVASKEYSREIIRYRREVLRFHKNGGFDGTTNLRKCRTGRKWLKGLERLSSEETCPEGMVPSRTYLLVRKSDGKVLGITDIRHPIEGHPILSAWGGNIGYSIRPTERGKGYGREILRLNLEKCREMGLTKVMVTCKKDNALSEKVIIANGGTFEKEVEGDGTTIKRFWIEL